MVENEKEMGVEISARETDVLRALAEHMTNAEIANSLHISVRTVESHVASLLRKLGASNRRELAGLAAGFIEEPGPVGAVRGIVGLPATLTSFVGRGAEIEGLLRLITESRLVTLVGPGGVGKTRLAIAVAGVFGAGSEHNGAFVNLVPVGPEFVVQAVAALFDVGEHPDETLHQALIRTLGSAPCLLVLDNCEHVLGPVASLTRSILESCPRVVVLATSRQRLDLEGERIFSVSPLALHGEGDETASSDAATLFVDRCSYTPGEKDDAETVQEICSRLDGIPLAIELAAARRSSLGLDGLLSGIDDRLRLLSRVTRTDDRHGSLRSVIGWSHDLLDPDERALFRKLAVFQGGFDLAAADAVAARSSVAETGDLIGRLADKSLLVRSDEAGVSRWRMLDMIRAFAQEQLESSGQLESTHEDHLDWASAEARRIVELLESGDPWQDRFDAVAADLRFAVGLAEKGSTAYQLAMALAHLAFARRYLAECREHLRVAVEKAPDDASAVRALRTAAGAAFSEMRGEVAYRLLTEASDRARAGGDDRTVAIVLADAAGLLGRAPALFKRRFDLHEVRGLLASAERLAPEGDLEVDAYLALAAAWCTDAGLASSEIAAAERALELARRLDDPRLLSSALDAATAAYECVHRYRQAARFTSERVALLDRIPRHDPTIGGEVADIYHMANEVAITTGDLRSALAVARRQVGDEATYGLAHFAANNLVIVLALMGEFEEAIEQADLMLAGWESAGRPRAGWMGPPYHAAAMVHGLRGDQESYAAWLDHAGAVTEGGTGSGFPRYSRARVALHDGELEGALEASGIPADEGTYVPFVAYAAAVNAEAAVLMGEKDRERRLAMAEQFAPDNDFVAAHVMRVQGLIKNDPESLDRSVAMWESMGARFERACTLVHIADRAAEGHMELRLLGCDRERRCDSPFGRL
jgi:predicted ATPase/DNA-binding CsgD family transcriptional regulator